MTQRLTRSSPHAGTEVSASEHRDHSHRESYNGKDHSRGIREEERSKTGENREAEVGGSAEDKQGESCGDTHRSLLLAIVSAAGLGTVFSADLMLNCIN
jgi:hypothetical protein